MTLLVLTWTEIWIAVAQLILSLSILVVLHEFGHYITAKWFKCRVEKFYLFFDPWFSIFKKKIGETVYGIGWLPLGGYVKISGMIDESMDKDAMKLPPQPWEFRSKPAWQRLIIMIGGVTVNVLLAFVIWAFILMIWGDKKVPLSSLKYGIHVQDSTLLKQGLKNGDKIVSVDGKSAKDLDLQQLSLKILLSKTIVAHREGKDTTINMAQNLIGTFVENRKDGVGLIGARVLPLVYFVPDTAKAYKAGLRNRDIIKKIDSVDIGYYDEMKNLLVTKKRNASIQVIVDRSGKDEILNLTTNTEGQIGFVPAMGIDVLDSLGWAKMEVKKYSFFAAFPQGVKKTGEQLSGYIDQVKKIFTPSTGAYKGIGGFRGIAKAFAAPVWDWENFWRITAFLSIMLAFMNLLPIPALDGGHVLFTLIEMITGRKPSDKFLEYAQIVGMILLLGLMLFANGNDWFGWGRGK